MRHLIADPHFSPCNGPASLTCQCGHLLAAPSPADLVREWQRHLADSGVRHKLYYRGDPVGSNRSHSIHMEARW